MEKSNGAPLPAYDTQSPQHQGQSLQPQHGQYQQPQQGDYQQQTPRPVLSQQQSQYQHPAPLQNLGESAAPVDCPSCGTRGLTRVEYHSGQTTLGWAVVACLCACLGCIPYLINGLKDVDHRCGHCGVLLAVWHRSGRTVVHAHS